MRLIVPAGKAATLWHRLGALNPALAIQVYELNALNEHIERVDPCRDGDVSSWLVPRRESESLKRRSSRL